MSNFVKIRKHEITSAYLHLDSRRYTDLVINQAEIASAGFDLEYPNGFGEVLPHLTLMLTSGDKIELYREDAKAAWKKLNEDEDEKLLKTIKDYAAHEHKDATPLDVALCIEQAIDNAQDNKWHYVKDGDLPEDFKDVLICDIHKNCMVGQRNSTAEENYVWEVPEDFMPDKEVLAWKEIEPPKIEKE